MRISTILTATLLTAVFGASPALAASDRVCLDIRKIDNAESKDGKIMTFHMHDGTVLQNHLKAACPGLTMGGFSWSVQSSDTEVCEDSQTLRTFITHETCVLGKFDPPVKPAPKG